MRRPAPHSVHAAALRASALLYRPLPQFTHCDSLCAADVDVDIRLPGAQAVQDASAERPVDELWRPELHTPSQASPSLDLPSEVPYLPAPHCSQIVREVDILYRPLSHCEQSFEVVSPVDAPNRPAAHFPLQALPSDFRLFTFDVVP